MSARIKREKLVGAQLDVPAEQNAGNRGQAGEQNQHAADAVGGQQEVNAHRRHPGHIDNHRASLAHAGDKARNSEREPGHGDAERQPARQGGLALGQQRQHQRSGKREIDRPRQHLKSPVRQQVHDRGVHAVHNQLRQKAESNIKPITGASAIRSPWCRSGKLAQCSGTGPVNTF